MVSGESELGLEVYLHFSNCLFVLTSLTRLPYRRRKLLKERRWSLKAAPRVDQAVVLRHLCSRRTHVTSDWEVTSNQRETSPVSWSGQSTSVFRDKREFCCKDLRSHLRLPNSNKPLTRTKVSQTVRFVASYHYAVFNMFANSLN